jgi:hypothetical protein
MLFGDSTVPFPHFQGHLEIHLMLLYIQWGSRSKKAKGHLWLLWGLYMYLWFSAQRKKERKSNDMRPMPYKYAPYRAIFQH